MRGRENQMDRSFSQFATYSSNLVGSPAAFLVALFTILGWFAVGPIFHFSDTWQLIINSWTNIATFVVVFLIQNAQNRDSKAINLKLAELIRAVGPARDDMVDIERLTDKELEELSQRYARIRLEWERRRSAEPQP
jgi:low affinity Fe/Cu permease